MFQHLSEFRIGSMRRTHVQTNAGGKGQIQFLFSNFQIDQLMQKKVYFSLVVSKDKFEIFNISCSYLDIQQNWLHTSVNKQTKFWEHIVSKTDQEKTLYCNFWVSFFFFKQRY